MKLSNLVIAVVLSALPIVAQATDLPNKQSAPSVSIAAVTVNWDGFYVGGNIGSGTKSTSIFSPAQYSEPEVVIGSNSGSGIIGGLQIGYDKKFGDYVLGLQSMFDFSGLSGSSIYPEYPTETMSSETPSLGSVSARAGYLLQPNLLAYVKGGLAWSDIRYSDVDTLSPYYGRASKTRTGWLIGGGLEYAMNKYWSAFVEYNHVDFGDKGITLNYTGDGVWWGDTTWVIDFDQKIDTALFGVNYRF